MRDRLRDPALSLTPDEYSRLDTISFGRGRLAAYARACELFDQTASSLRGADDTDAIARLAVEGALAGVVAANREALERASATVATVDIA